MSDDSRRRWSRLPKVNIDSRVIRKRIRKAQGATVRHAHKFLTGRWGSVRESQRHITKWVLIMGLLIAATGFQLMWYQKNYRTTAPTETGTYAEAVLGPVDTLNPLFADSSAEQSAGHLLFSRLLSYDTTGHLGYDIASNVQINDAKTVYTVTIRPDVKWHDGYLLTADDVVFTVGLIKNASVNSTISGWDNISVKFINANTIEFSMDSTYAAFEHLLTFPILPKHILGDILPANVRENAFSQSPIGSGPFKLSYVQDVDATASRKVIYMVRNVDYYGGMAKIERFQLHVYNTADDIIKAFAINEVNAVADLSPAEIGKINAKKYSVSSTPIQSGVYAILNNTATLLKDVNVRRALQLATDAPAIRRDLAVNSPSLDLPIINTQLFGELPKASAYSLEEAKKTLGDNGWVLGPDGIRKKDGVEFRLSMVVMKDSELEQVLSVIVDQWRKLGINIETKIVDPNDVAQNVVQGILQPRNFDVLLYRLNIGADPDVYAYWHSSQASSQGSNYSNYSSAISDDALSSARVRAESDLRNAKYITFVKQWLSDVPAIGLYQSTVQYVHTKEVSSFAKTNMLVSSVDRYSDVLNWSVGTKSVYKTP